MSARAYEVAKRWISEGDAYKKCVEAERAARDVYDVATSERRRQEATVDEWERELIGQMRADEKEGKTLVIDDRAITLENRNYDTHMPWIVRETKVIPSE